MSSDLILRCAACGTPFVWTAGEQAGGTAAPEHCAMCRRLAPPAGRQRGLVKWFSRAKGYGFITPVSGAELFVHKSELAPGPALPSAGQLVEYRLGHGPRGAQAEDVMVLEEAETLRDPNPSP